MIRRVESMAGPNSASNNSEAPSATRGCSLKSGAVTSPTLRRTICLTRFREPSWVFTSATAFSAASRAAPRRAASLLDSKVLTDASLEARHAGLRGYGAAEEQEVAGLHGLSVDAQGSGWLREGDSQLQEAQLGG
jgi:hypothetical protein